MIEFNYFYLKEVLPFPRFHVYLTLVNVVNVGKIWKRTPETTRGSGAAPHHWFLRKNWQMSPFMDKINLVLKLDEKSRDHEVIIGESDNSQSPISKEFKRKIFSSRIIRERPLPCCWTISDFIYTGDEEKM